MTVDEKKLLLKEIEKYIYESNHFTDGTFHPNDLYLIGWVADEFRDRKEAMRLLINNEYGLLGNLMNKHMRDPEAAISNFMERADKELLIKALASGGNGVLDKNGLTDDAYAMRLLMESNIKYAKYLDRSLINSQEFISSVISIYPEIVSDTTVANRSDRNFIFSLVGKNHRVMQYLPREYRHDRDICYEVVKREGFSLMWVDLELRGEDEFVLAAVSNRGNALSMASPEQRKNKTIVMAAVRNCGLAIEYADESLKHDYEVVITAVGTHGIALRYVPEEFRNMPEVVRRAVETDGYAISLAPEKYRDSYEYAELAMKTYPAAIKYLSPRLQAVPEFIEIYKRDREKYPWLRSKTRHGFAKGSC